MPATPLGERITPRGPIVDGAAAERARERLAELAARDGWADLLDAAWAALAPVFAASAYLTNLSRRLPDALRRVLAEPAEARLAGLLAADSSSEAALRDLKAEIHLLTALADLGGVWDLEAVTGALTAFADKAVRAAFEIAARENAAAGRLIPSAEEADGFVAGLFCIAMGKHGAGELNYSSDIDISVFFDPVALNLGPKIEAQAFASRFTDRVAEILQRRTADGYVFRVDLRLRPDPSSTPVAVSLPAAYNYYESVGQNWERAAFIKARVVAGDTALGDAFLANLQPFIWRRNLDFAAIADIHSIKRQIHAYKVDDRLTAAGADLKLGRGGIREIEFFVQTQQLILGGRQPQLRSRGTLETLATLTRLGHVAPDDRDILDAAYRRLRALEHRAQMIGDEQTHRLPENDGARKAVAALAGYARLPTFDAEVGRTLSAVNAIYGALFAGEEALSSRHGSLVFTGVDDDPETLATLARMGFAGGPRVAEVIRRWHHGRIPATRTECGRELFTRLAPRLLDAVAETGAPDAAFDRFADFFGAVAAGVQLQSLLLAQPKLLDLLVRVMAFAPVFARTLSRRPAALDALLDPDFFGRVDADAEVAARLRPEAGFEAAMDQARRLRTEIAFRIGVQVLSGAANAPIAGAAFADLADALVGGLARVSLAEVERGAGTFDGEVAVIALGKCGSREMSARSDLDLMTLYRSASPAAASTVKGWSAETFYARFTQRLVAALSAPTREGGLYEVDLQLRPSGTKGPVAVSAAAFARYYQGDAETWELLALTRARVVWATSRAFANDATAAIEAALRRPRDLAATARDVGEMRELMTRERPAAGFWDVKLSAGGLVDIEFCAQFLQLVGAADGGPLRQNTAEALAALAAAEPGRAGDVETLIESWRLQQAASQLLKIALDDDADPAAEPTAFRALLAKITGQATFPDLVKAIAQARVRTREVFQRLLA
jgi:glutamate-ammonia-ligase adenylyltransferase